LSAGKHVLYEKALAINADEGRETIGSARRNGRFRMEAIWSWFNPVWHKLRIRMAAGAIGEVISVDANFAIPLLDEKGRHRRPDLAGGALLDLGIYPLSISRFLLGEPVEVKALGRSTHHGVDDFVGGVMRHRSGAVTTFTTSIDGAPDLAAPSGLHRSSRSLAMTSRSPSASRHRTVGLRLKSSTPWNRSQQKRRRATFRPEMRPPQIWN